ncbi:MAG: hypothetical protein SPK09_00210 [Porphyromonas sp.]|nr:hypothetical protein [Porphyromonas sp.]
MNKYLSCLGLLLTLSVGTPLLAQTSKATTKQQATTNPSHTARVKKYQDWLVKEGYRPVKSENDGWVTLEFKSEGVSFLLNIDKESEWVYLFSGMSFNEDDKSLWWTRVYAANKTNLEYSAVEVDVSEEDGSVSLETWAIDPKPEYIESYLEIAHAAARFYGKAYTELLQQLEEEAKKQSEKKKK